MNPWKRWAIRCGFIGGLIILGAWLFRGITNMAPIEIPDWADSLANVRDAYTMDSVYWAEQHEADSLRAETYRGEAESWRRRSLAARPARPLKPDSSEIRPDFDGNSTDSASYSELSAKYDSLWTALDAADSAFANLEQAFTAQRQATADAKAGWAAADSALLRERATGLAAIRDLTAKLRSATRRNRLLGFLPMPEVVCGYGATLAAGAVQHGPSCTAGIRVRF